MEMMTGDNDTFFLQNKKINIFLFLFIIFIIFFINFLDFFYLFSSFVPVYIFFYIATEV